MALMQRVDAAGLEVETHGYGGLVQREQSQEQQLQNCMKACAFFLQLSSYSPSRRWIK